MRYTVIESGTIHIHFEPNEDVLDRLLAIAEHSYETAMPRGRGGERRHLRSVDNPPDFIEFIKFKDGQPVALIMDYIDGRDCRTCIKKHEDLYAELGIPNPNPPEDPNYWFFNAHAFQQRRVTREEFLAGIVDDPADRFLDEVIRQLEEKK